MAQPKGIEGLLSGCLHQFLIPTHYGTYKDTIAYNDREFEMILDQYQGYLPRNLRVYHYREGSSPGLILSGYPEIHIPVYELSQSKYSVPDGLRLYTRRGPRSGIPVKRRCFDFVWVNHDDPGGLIAYLDGQDHSLISPYTAVPITFREAAEYVNFRHRHNTAPQGHKFSIALRSVEGCTAGVLIASEPKSRNLCDGTTLEINRCCTDPRYHNVCSALIGRAVRMGKEMGYTRFVSYTLESENGASLKAVGFKSDGLVKGRPAGWNVPSRPRNLPEMYPTGNKKRWILRLKQQDQQGV